MMTVPAFPRRTYRTKAGAMAAARYAEDTARVRTLLNEAQRERAHRNYAAVVMLLGVAASIRPALAPAHVAAGTAVTDADWRAAFRLADNAVRAMEDSQRRERGADADPLDFSMAAL